MKTFLVAGQMTVSCFLEVKATDAEQAREIAATAPALEWGVELDGKPENLEVQTEEETA